MLRSIQINVRFQVFEWNDRGVSREIDDLETLREEMRVEMKVQSGHQGKIKVQKASHSGKG